MYAEGQLHAREERGMRILKWLGGLVVLAGVGLAVAYALRSDPIGPIAGRALTGETVSERIEDWSFTDDHMLIAVETRPEDPHSVTTACFTQKGELYVPATNGSSKQWTQHVVSDPRVRLKIGDRIYPARAERVTDPTRAEEMRAAARAKYNLPEEAGAELEDVWLFRIRSTGVDVAAP